MNTAKYFFFCLIGLAFGFVFFAYMQEWIIIRSPLQKFSNIDQDSDAHQTIKKKAKLIYWRKGKWHTENQELLWPSNKADQLFYLINSWLSLLDEENVMDNKVTLQTAILSHSGQEAFLSFDRNPLPAECSTFETWMWIEGLLKTIRENGIQLQSVRFLVHHEPLVDEHLDFTNSWPMQGFLER